MEGPRHLHLLVRAEIRSPPGPHDRVRINERVRKLVHDIGMRVLITPQNVYSYRTADHMDGMSGLVGIETSHITYHIWNTPNPEFLVHGGPSLLQMDVYTCGELQDEQIEKIMDFVGEFAPVFVEYMVINRETGLVVLKHEKRDVFGSQQTEQQQTPQRQQTQQRQWTRQQRQRTRQQRQRTRRRQQRTRR